MQYLAGECCFPCKPAVCPGYCFSSKALLRQTGGFEGFGAMAEQLLLAHLSIAEREDQEEMKGDRDRCS